MEKRSRNGGLKKLLTAKNGGGLALRIVVLLAIPYAYLMLCGLIFDRLLRWYFMTNFIFFSLLVLYVLAVVLIVCAVRWYRAGQKKKEK